jgi:hypothetical protein
MSKDPLLVIVIWVILCAVAIVLSVSSDSVSSAFYTHYFSFMQIVTSIGAAFLCYRTMRVFELSDKTRTAWGFLSIGLLFWGIGAIMEGFYPILYQGKEAAFPWYSDIAFLMLAPFAIMSLNTFRKNTNVNIPRWGWITTLLVFFVTFGFALLINMKGFHELSLLAFITTMAYITLDSILLAMTVATTSILMGGIISRLWGFALAGLFIFYLGDITYVFLRNINQPDAVGIILYLTWPIGFGLIAIAATTARTIYKAFE